MWDLITYESESYGISGFLYGEISRLNELKSLLLETALAADIKTNYVNVS
jgi:hypothetical protein